MKVVFTSQSIKSLEEALRFLVEEIKIPKHKVKQIKNAVLKKAEHLEAHPHLGQHEEYLEHMNLGHRRVIEGNFKIIYRIEGSIIYVTDFFDVRQDPYRMKG